MRERIKAKQDTMLGLVFFGALGLLLLATFWFGNLALGGRTIQVTFEDARGLRIGDPVFVLGIRMGRVTGVEVLTPAAAAAPQVQLELLLEKKIDLGQSPTIEIRDSSLLGGKVVWVTPDPNGKGMPLAAVKGLKGEGGLLGGLAEAFGIGEQQKTEIQQIIGGINTVVTEIAEGRGTLGALVRERALHDDLAASLSTVRELVADLQAGKGSAGKFLKQSELYDGAERLVQNLEAITASVRSGQGLLARLINDTALADHVAAIADDLRHVSAQLRSGEGLLARLINDGKLGNDIAEAADGLAKLITEARTGEGLIARLLTDKQLADDLGGILEDVRLVTQKIAAGEGNLGRLIMDDTMVLKLERAIANFSATLEDAREAAPIGTFFQVFGGLFY